MDGKGGEEGEREREREGGGRGGEKERYGVRRKRGGKECMFHVLIIVENYSSHGVHIHAALFKYKQSDISL